MSVTELAQAMKTYTQRLQYHLPRMVTSGLVVRVNNGRRHKYAAQALFKSKEVQQRVMADVGHIIHKWGDLVDASDAREPREAVLLACVKKFFDMPTLTNAKPDK